VVKMYFYPIICHWRRIHNGDQTWVSKGPSDYTLHALVMGQSFLTVCVNLNNRENMYVISRLTLESGINLLFRGYVYYF
jgi:hypothetical protein